jgi:hypothetical protein
MPTNLRIDPLARIVYSTLSGTIETEDLIRQVAAIRAHPQFNPEFNELIDASAVTSFNVSSEDVRRLASRDSTFSPSADRVFVATQDLVFGLARMFQTFSAENRPRFTVVRSLSEAYSQLGLDGAKLINPRC